MFEYLMPLLVMPTYEDTLLDRTCKAAVRAQIEYGRARDEMLKSTHSANAPWTLVNFNDQKRGRLTLIRHLLDALPDTALPEPVITLPPLKGKPAKERYSGPVKPIADAFPD